MKSSDPIQRSDSCSLGVRVFWLARFPGVAYVAIRFMRVRSDTRIASGDRLEVRKRRADGEREMLPAARRDSHVLSKDRCPLFGRYGDEVNEAPASLADNGFATRSFDVLHQSESGPSMDTR